MRKETLLAGFPQKQEVVSIGATLGRQRVWPTVVWHAKLETKVITLRTQLFSQLERRETEGSTDAKHVLHVIAPTVDLLSAHLLRCRVSSGLRRVAALR